jgi:hypothetical protein
MQRIIALALLILAAFFVLRRLGIIRSASGRDGRKGCGGCGCASHDKKNDRN